MYWKNQKKAGVYLTFSRTWFEGIWLCYASARKTGFSYKARESVVEPVFTLDIDWVDIYFLSQSSLTTSSV